MTAAIVMAGVTAMMAPSNDNRSTISRRTAIMAPSNNLSRMPNRSTTSRRMIIDHDCVILIIPGPPALQKQRGYLIRQKISFNPNKNDQRKLKNALMKEVAMKDLHKMLPWAKNTALCVTAVFLLQFD